MMEIYIVRHGIAEEHAAGGDAQRALTDDGKVKMREVAAGLARIGVESETILSSPFVRARQTAEILAFPIKGRLSLLTELAPGHGPSEVCQRLSEMHNVTSVMLVGHQPNCTELAAYLLCAPEKLDMEFKKGAVCLIEADRPAAARGTLIWLLPPKALRLAASS